MMNTAAFREVITKESIVEAVKLLDKTGPIKNFIRRQGVEPNEGWVLYLPMSFKFELGAPEGKHLKYSPVIERPVLLNEGNYHPPFNFDFNRM